MSLHPQPIGDIPEETQRVARAAFPKGTLYMTMRDELGTFFQDEDFAALFPSRGQSAVSPWRLALVTVMQFAENLTDRQAADAVRSRIDWKYALGLELTDAGFDFSVLSEFRSRLITHESEQQLLDAMLKRFQEKGLLKARGRQRTDATHVLSRTRDLTRIELAGETMRQALNTLATVAPAWLKAHVPVEWFDRYGKPFSDYRMPKTEAEQQALVETIGQDGYQLWQWIAEREDQDWMRQIPAVEILRQVWVQQFYIEADQIRWRKKN
jgi:transposase